MAKALDKENRLYYSQESFDDFYYGKGSTYPDINGSASVFCLSRPAVAAVFNKTVSMAY